MAHTKGTALVDRIALAVGEQRTDLGISLNLLSRLTGVSRSTLATLERGGRVDPAVVVKVAGVLNTLELAPPPPEQSEPPVFDLVAELRAIALAGAA